MKITSISENTVLILFDQVINPDNFALVKNSMDVIEEALDDYIIDIIPSYASIHISFNLTKVSGMEFRKKLTLLLGNQQQFNEQNKSTKIINIPVYYGPEVGFDIDFIAQRAQLNKDEVARIHSDKTYDVYAIGFTPGFAYLGCVDERISCPRKHTPRSIVPKGSLGIADLQTAIYPVASPGGWQIIGRTPLKLLDYTQESLTPFSTGDKVKFIPIDKSEFLRLGGEM